MEIIEIINTIAIKRSVDMALAVRICGYNYASHQYQCPLNKRTHANVQRNPDRQTKQRRSRTKRHSTVCSTFPEASNYYCDRGVIVIIPGGPGRRRCGWRGPPGCCPSTRAAWLWLMAVIDVDKLSGSDRVRTTLRKFRRSYMIR